MMRTYSSLVPQIIPDTPWGVAVEIRIPVAARFWYIIFSRSTEREREKDVYLLGRRYLSNSAISITAIFLIHPRVRVLNVATATLNSTAICEHLNDCDI